jgi:hypothetical protein
MLLQNATAHIIMAYDLPCYRLWFDMLLYSVWGAVYNHPLRKDKKRFRVFMNLPEGRSQFAVDAGKVVQMNMTRFIFTKYWLCQRRGRGSHVGRTHWIGKSVPYPHTIKFPPHNNYTNEQYKGTDGICIFLLESLEWRKDAVWKESDGREINIYLVHTAVT